MLNPDLKHLKHLNHLKHLKHYIFALGLKSGFKTFNTLKFRLPRDLPWVSRCGFTSSGLEEEPEDVWGAALPLRGVGFRVLDSVTGWMC